MLSNSPRSVISSLCGILGGLAYKSDILGLNRWKLPSFITQFFSRFIRPFIESTSTRTNVQRAPIPIQNNTNNRQTFSNAFNVQVKKIVVYLKLNYK